MKKILLLFVLLFSLSISQIEAKGVIIYNNGPKVEVKEKLPAEFVTDDGTHVNLGVMYDQFGLFWMPVWNYGTPEYVLLSDDENTYWDLTQDQIAKLKSEYNLTVPDEPEPSLWNKIGLKPVILILIGLIVWSYIPKKEENKPEDQNVQS